MHVHASSRLRVYVVDRRLCLGLLIFFREGKMSETSGGSKMAARGSKQCHHCKKELEMDSLFCNRCGKPQKEDSPEPETYCINPDCKERLFTISAKACHKCNMAQRPEDDTERTQQQNLGDRDTKDQRKAVESVRKEGKQGDNNQTQKKAGDTKNERNQPLLCTSTTDAQETSHQTEIGEQMEAHSNQPIHGDSNISQEQPKSKKPPQEQPQPKSKKPPQEQPQPKSKIPSQEQPQTRMATTADSHTAETTLVFPSDDAPLPQQPQAPSDDAPLPRQPQAPSDDAPLPQQPQAPSDDAPLPRQPQAPSDDAPLPRQPQAPSDDAPLPQQPQAPSDDAPLPQQPQAPSDDAPLPQQPQAPSDDAPLPQQPQAPSDDAPLPQQPQAPSDDAPLPQQPQAPSDDAPLPQQPQAPSDDAPLPQQPTATTIPSELKQSSQESGATPLHEIDDQKQVSTTLPTPDKLNNDNCPITNQSQESQPKHDDSGNMAVPKDESGQSSTQTQSTSIPLKTAASTSKTPSQQAVTKSEVLTKQNYQVSVS